MAPEDGVPAVDILVDHVQLAGVDDAVELVLRGVVHLELDSGPT